MRAIATAVLAVALLAGIGGGSSNASAGMQAPAGGAGNGLHVAAIQGDLGAARRLIRSGADLNAKDQWGSTPLIVATTFGRTDVARALIEAGADLEIANNERSTPLHLAAFFSRPEIAEALLARGADRYARNVTGSTPLDLVLTPFEYDRDLLDRLGAGLAPLGLRLDYGRIEKGRARIARMLRPTAEELAAVDYAPAPGDGWEVATPADEDIEPALVAELFQEAAHLETLHGLLVIRHGRLIAEGYFNGATAERKSRIQSVSKSFTSALVGIALEQGCLPDVDHKVLDYFPESAGSIEDPRKKDITIRHLLEMRGGFPWEETDSTLWNALLSGTYPSKLAEVPLISDPGAAFNYSNLSTNWLGIIVARACETDLQEFADEHLFGPLGIEAGDWTLDRDGYRIGCCELQFSARDLARFGLLYLNDGAYGGRQVVPADWVRASLASYSDDAWVAHARLRHAGRYFRDLGYGYQWWSATAGGHDVDFAWGHGGQYVFLLHDLDMVVVVTSDPQQRRHSPEAWRHELSNINLAGRFISALPGS